MQWTAQLPDEVIEKYKQGGLAVVDGHTDQGIPVVLFYGTSLQDLIVRISRISMEALAKEGKVDLC